MISLFFDFVIIWLVSLASGAMLYIGVINSDAGYIVAAMLAPVIASWLFVSEWIRNGTIQISDADGSRERN